MRAGLGEKVHGSPLYLALLAAPLMQISYKLWVSLTRGILLNFQASSFKVSKPIGGGKDRDLRLIAEAPVPLTNNVYTILMQIERVNSAALKFFSKPYEIKAKCFYSVETHNGYIGIAHEM